MGNPQLEVRIGADLGIFTRPDSRVDRQSYPVITPTAARGILRQIYWKPEMLWVIRAIAVLTEPRFINHKTNEVSRSKPTRGEHCINVNACRTQRHNQLVHNPQYVVRAEIYCFDQSPESREFYQFLKTLETYKNSLTSGDRLILTTETDFYKYLKSFREDASLGTYLTRIAVNLSLNELKRRKRRQEKRQSWRTEDFLLMATKVIRCRSA